MSYIKQHTTILLVDDDEKIRKLIMVYLKNEAYNILQAGDGIEALKLLEVHTIDCIVLDVMMPKQDGIQTLIKIREDRIIPVILLTARGEDMDKISGLSLGADDYVTKPFNPLELVARIKAQIRRNKYLHEKTDYDSKITYKEMVINLESRQIKIETHEVILTPKEFDILVLLARNPSTVFSSEQIYERVWKDESYGSENTVMVHIRKIREKLERASGNKFIETVWGVGYKML